MAKVVNRAKLSANAKARKRDANGRFMYEGGSKKSSTKKKTTPKATSGDKATPKTKSKTAKDDLAKIDKVKPKATKGQKSRLVKNAAKARKENDYRNLTDLGEKVVGKQALKDLEDSYKAYKKKADKREQQLRDTWDKYDRAFEAGDDKKAKYHLTRYNKLRESKDLDQLQRIVEARAQTIIDKLHGEPRKDLVSGIKAGKNLQNKALVAKSVSEFFGLSEGKGSTQLKTIDTKSKRAYATPSTGLINTGVHKTPGDLKRTLYHEIGHMVESENPKIQARVKDWVAKRTEGETAQKMSDLTGNPRYRDDEVAKPDKFISPYIGKIYASGDTEALSMGVEALSSPYAFTRLLTADREHLLLTIGALKSV